MPEDECSISSSVLNSVKTLIGVSPSDGAFDSEIRMDINGVLLTVQQLGYTLKRTCITDSSTLWSDLFLDKEFNHLVVTYIYLKVRLLFDPPQSGVLNEALERQIKEVEWRIMVEVEFVNREVPKIEPVLDSAGNRFDDGIISGGLDDS